MSLPVSEIKLTAELARLLCERGLIGAGEFLIKKSDQLKRPDIPIWLNGLKVIIEGKLHKDNAKFSLETDSKKRINEGLCEIAIGIIYNPRTFQNQITFDQFAIFKLLEDSIFQVKIWHISEIGSKVLYDKWLSMNITDLAHGIKEAERNIISGSLLQQIIEDLSAFTNYFSETMKEIE